MHLLLFYVYILVLVRIEHSRTNVKYTGAGSWTFFLQLDKTSYLFFHFQSLC